MQECCQQVAAQTEQLLWLAYRLQLAPLIEELHVFLRLTMPVVDGVLEHHVDAVFTERVLDAALGSNKLGKDAWIMQILHHVHALAPGSKHALFKPIGLTAEQQQRTSFRAVLQREFFEAPAGTEIEVTFDLLGTGHVYIGNYWFEATLQLL